MTPRRSDTDPQTPHARGPALLPRFAHLAAAASYRVTALAALAKRTRSEASTKPQAPARKVSATTRPVTKPAQRTQAKSATPHYDFSHLSAALLPTPSTPHPTPAQLEARTAQREARAADRAMNRALAQLRGEAVPQAQRYGLTRAQENEVEALVERARAAGVIR